MHKLVVCLVACLLWLAPGAATYAASGTALGVKPQASATTKSETRILTVGADLFIGDKVVTGASGLVQIRFSDQTELVVGPRSSLVLEDYLLREDGSAGKFAINALSGTFRFVTGGAPKDKYLITTPTGTIGVRGTAFDFNVDDKNTSVLLYHGAVILCNDNKVCVTLDNACQIGQYDLSESRIIGFTDEITGAARAALRSTFEYAVSQSPLLRQFWVEQARDCLNRKFVAPEQDNVTVTGDQPKR